MGDLVAESMHREMYFYFATQREASFDCFDFILFCEICVICGSISCIACYLRCHDDILSQCSKQRRGDEVGGCPGISAVAVAA